MTLVTLSAGTNNSTRINLSCQSFCSTSGSWRERIVCLPIFTFLNTNSYWFLFSPSPSILRVPFVTSLTIVNFLGNLVILIIVPDSFSFQQCIVSHLGTTSLLTKRSASVPVVKLSISLRLLFKLSLFHHYLFLL